MRQDDQGAVPAASTEPAAPPSLRLAEALSARLCHDLSSPIGGIGNALELIEEPELVAEAIALARDGVVSLTARLQLARAAWCRADAPLDVAAIAHLARSLTERRVRVDLGGLDQQAKFTPLLSRLLLNLLLLAAESLPGGGDARLAGDAEDGIVLTIDGPNAAWPPGLATLLLRQDAAWSAIGDPRALQAPLTAVLAVDAGFRLSLLLGATVAAPPLLLQRGA